MHTTRPLGASGIQTTPVMFGAWAIGGWMWGGNDEADSIAAIRAALDSGVNSIDTAPVYGFGYSEELVARAIQGRNRSKIILATKCGLRWDTDQGSEPRTEKDNAGNDIVIRKNGMRDSIFHECEQSLRRLKTDVIDLYQLHRPDPATPVEDTVLALDALRRQGKVRAIGVSNFNIEQLRAAAAVTTIDTVQPQYNLLRREIEAEILPFCRQRGIGVIAYSPMARGLLTGKIGPERIFSPGDHRENGKMFSVDNRKRVIDALEKIRPIAERHEASFAQLAIAWVFSEPGVSSAIVGARNARQAADNALAMRVHLTVEERNQMRAVFDGVIA